MPEIVPATTGEQIEQARCLLREYQCELPADLRFPDREWLNLPGEYSPPRGALLLATIAGQPSGCVGLRPFPLPGTCEMKRLYVRPAFRGDKLGRILVDTVCNLARTLGYACIRLDTHPPTMQRAMELYRNLGFIEVSPDPVPLVPGLSYMQLLL